MFKEEISSSYINAMKSIHGHKEHSLDKVATVTGVSPNNIGEAIIQRFKVGRIPSYQIEEKSFDLTNNHDIERMGNILSLSNVLVLCHGHTHLDWIENQSIKNVDRVLNASLVSHIKIVSQFVINTIDSDERKVIIIIGSMAASAVLNASAPYCAAKAGLQHFVKCIAWELAPKGYDVYLINPSNVADSPMSDATMLGLQRYRGMTKEQAHAYWSAGNPRNEFLSKDEIAELTYTLATGKFPYLSGTPLNMGGGQR